MAPSVFWKLALAGLLAALVIASVAARAPRKPLPRTELWWLIVGALTLYAVGLVAEFNHRSQTSILLSAAGIGTSALAVWLSRGTDHGAPPRGDESFDEPPPPDPDGLPMFDWVGFERDLRAYLDRSRLPAARR